MTQGRRSQTTRSAVTPKFPIPSPPKDISKEAAAVWRKTCEDKAWSDTWLRKVDHTLLRLYCETVVDEKALGAELAKKPRGNQTGAKWEKIRLGRQRLRTRKADQIRKLGVRLALSLSQHRDSEGKIRDETKKELRAKNLAQRAIVKAAQVQATAEESDAPVVLPDIPTPDDAPWIPVGKTIGQQVIHFIETFCCIPEGRDVGKSVVLRPWQKKIITGIYDTPTRRGIISFGRKNAKTTLAALLTLAHLVGPRALRNGNIFSDAQSREQAGILFGLAAKCIRTSPLLVGYVNIRETFKQLYCPALGVLYRALSAEVTTSFGLSSPFVVHDELGQVRGPRSELYDAIETAMGAYDAPLSLVISTQAPSNNDLLSILIDDAKGGADPRVKLFMYEADQNCDVMDEDQWRKANPAYGDFLNADEVRAQAETAFRMPAREAAFRNLILNQRVDAEQRFVSVSVWEENGVAPLPLKGKAVYGGLDLASSGDLCALVLCSDGGDVHCTFWLPEEGLAERSRDDRVEYDVWEKRKFITAVPGRTIEYRYVAECLRGLFDTLDIRSIAFDRYNMRFLVPWLREVGFTEEEITGKFKEFGQGYASMSGALRELEEKLLGRKLKHGNNPVLTMCAQNSVVVSDDAGNRKFSKSRASGRIDGMVALAMAVGNMPIAATVSGDEGVQFLFLGPTQKG